jgi:hypothetical protein
MANFQYCTVVITTKLVTDSESAHSCSAVFKRQTAFCTKERQCGR